MQPPLPTTREVAESAVARHTHFADALRLAREGDLVHLIERTVDYLVEGRPTSRLLQNVLSIIESQSWSFAGENRQVSEVGSVYRANVTSKIKRALHLQ